MSKPICLQFNCQKSKISLKVILYEIQGRIHPNINSAPPPPAVSLGNENIMCFQKAMQDRHFKDRQSPQDSYSLPPFYDFRDKYIYIVVSEHWMLLIELRNR